MGRCYNKITIDKLEEKVWSTIRSFHDMSWAKGVIEKLEVVGEIEDGKPGAKRILNDVFHETLLELNDSEQFFKYRIDDGPGPVAKDKINNYIGSVKVSLDPSGTGTLVEWESNFESSDEGAVTEMCNPIYQALLNALKSHVS